MKPATTRLTPILAATILAALGILPSALAVNFTWRGGAGNWTDANWNLSVPGSTILTTNADTALFNTGGANTIAVDNNRNLKFFTFDTSVGSYTFNTGTVLLTSGGAILLAATTAGTNLTETFNTPLKLYGSYTFTNARVDAGSALVFAGNITNGATSTLTLSGAGTGTGNLISGNIGDGTGVQALTITTTSGKWTLSGANSYSGLTSITGLGGITVMQGGNSSGGAITLNAASATLQLDSASNGGLASGLLTLTAGKLEALTTGRSISNAITLTAVTVQGAQNLTFNGKLTGATASDRVLTNNLTGGSTLTLSDVDINTETANVRRLTIVGTGNTAFAGTIANGNGTTANTLFVTSSGTTTLSGANTYSGLTSITGAGGTTVMRGSNNSAGAVTLNNATATLQLDSASNGGLASGLLTVSAGKIEAINAARTLSNNLLINDMTIQGSQDLTFNGKVSVHAGAARTLTVNNSGLTTFTTFGMCDASQTPPLTINGTGAVAISGVLSNGGGSTYGNSGASNGLYYAGSSTLTLAGANIYSGTTTVNSGVVSINSLADGGNTFTIYTASGVTTATVSSATGLAVGQTIITQNQSGGSSSLQAGTTITNISGTNITLSLAANVTSTVGNSFAGTPNSLGLSTNVATNLVLDGGTLQYTGAAVSTDRLFTLGVNGGALDASGSGAVNFTGNGNMVLNTPTTTARTLTLTGTNIGNNTLAAKIRDAGVGGATSLAKTGTGMWILTNSGNSYTGGTLVSGGTLKTGTGGNVLGTGGVTISGGVLDLRDFNVGNVITNNGGAILLPTSTGAQVTNFVVGSQYGLQRTSTGSHAVTAALLNNTMVTNGTAVTTSFSGTTANAMTDVFHLGGTGSDTLVLKLDYSALVDKSGSSNFTIGWRAEGGSSNFDIVGTGSNLGAYVNQTTIGQWGLDTAANYAWVVTDHNSEYAIISVPEPAALTLFALGGLALLRRRRVGISVTV